MTKYKLIARNGSVIAQSSNRTFLSNLQRANPGSHIQKSSGQISSTLEAIRSNRGLRPRQSKPARKSTPPPAMRGSLRIVPSSWIWDYKYDALTGELHLNMRGRWYGPWYISPNVFTKFITGQAVPTTTDSRRPARWGKGIGPSVGAAYHQFIKVGGVLPLAMTLEQQLIRKQQLLAQIA